MIITPGKGRGKEYKNPKGFTDRNGGLSEQVRLVEVDISQRAPVLKAYLQLARGARPHIAVSKDAPIAEFEKIASKYPVFKVENVE